MNSDYEIVIIGAGIAGLTCGALLAKDGKKVAIVEKNPFVGGYCGSLKKDGFTFDLVSTLLGCGEGGKIYKILKEIGVEKEPKFIRIKNYLTLHLIDGEIVEISSELKEVIERLSMKFPFEQEGIKKLFNTMEGIYRELYVVSDIFKGSPNFLSSYHIRKYSNSTYMELLDEFIQSKKLKFILSAIAASFGGMSVDMVSALYLSNVIMTFFNEGGYLPMGGMHKLPDAISRAFYRLGGTLIIEREVNKIIVNNNVARGIELSDGSVILAPCIISNVDVNQTFFSLVGEENLPKGYIEKLKTFKTSPSAFMVNLGLNLDLNNLPLSHMTLLLPTTDPDELTLEIKKMIEGNVSGFCIAHIPTLSDHSLSPEGKHIVNLITLPAYNCNKDWANEGDIIAGEMICELERLIPQVSNFVVHKSFISPYTLEKYTRNYKGACFGWSHVPEQFGIRRLQQKTPLKGLFLTGHWTVPGGGVTASMISSVMARNIVSEYLKTIK